MRVFHCDHCDQLLFFENVNCVRCGRALAYVLELHDLASLDPAGGTQWTSPLSGQTFRLCANYVNHNVCNWALPNDDPNALCRACRLTRTIPDLSRAGNHKLWYDLEVAKRRLIYTLHQLRLPLDGGVDAAGRGLQFDFLADPADPSLPPVMTGHADGIITVNLAEADHAERVKRRIELGESYRTLLGHFRHEVGHYYWDRLVRGSALLDAFRQLFGDERASYDAALHRHYRGGPTGWHEGYVSAYAAMHPWEDWAETWAHYLHMVDTLETAAACGISLAPRRTDEPTLERVADPVAGRASFEHLTESWGAITYVLDNLNRGLGNDDAYPFVLSTRAIEKLRFVHETIAART